MLVVGCVVLFFTVTSVVNGGDLVEPIKTVKRGYQGRVEYISAEMNKTHLNKGSAPSAAVLAYVEGMTAFERDVAGQMIPRDLGGTGNETYNFIPMNCFISGLWQLFVVQPVYSLVNEGKVVKLSIVLTYDNATSTRPSKIDSSIDDSKTVKNSSLDNPVPMFVCDQPMIPQSQIVNNKTTITTITTVTISNTTVFVPNPLWGSNVTNKGVDFFKTVSSKDVTKMPQTQVTGSEATNEDKQPQTTPLSTYETTTATEKPPQRNRRPIKILKSRPKTVTSSTTLERGCYLTVEDYYAKETRGLGTEATNEDKHPHSTPLSTYETTTTANKPPQRNRRPIIFFKCRPKTGTSSTTTESGYSVTVEDYYAKETRGLGTEATNEDKHPHTTPLSTYETTTATEKSPQRNRPLTIPIVPQIPIPPKFHKSWPKTDTTSTTTESGYSVTVEDYYAKETRGLGTEATNEDNILTKFKEPLRYGLNIGDRHVKAGSNLTLTCNLLNQDTIEPIDVKFKWQKNDMLLAPVEGRIIPQGNQLVIANADEEDSGNYTCLFDYNGREGITDPVVVVVQRTLLHPDCKDHQYLANCTLMVNARYCFHKYYSKFCCKSCTEAGQLPEHQPGAPPPWLNLLRHNRRHRSFGRMLPSRLTPINAPDHETDFKVRFKSPIVEKFSLH